MARPLCGDRRCPCRWPGSRTTVRWVQCGIYGILFPEQPPPDSPYMDDAWSEGAREYENFLEKEESELLGHFLEENQTPSRVACASDSGQKIMQKAIKERFQVLFTRWKP